MDSSPGGERSNNKSKHMYVGEASRRCKDPVKYLLLRQPNKQETGDKGPEREKYVPAGGQPVTMQISVTSMKEK